MCVTIDESVHSWLKSKPEMMSRVVNGILKDSMLEEIKANDDRPEKICVQCESTYLTHRIFCPKHWCNGELMDLDDRSKRIEAMRPKKKEVEE
tara:strand:- start:183 stop:461 length:279 start_codon:yes stop_codon:yes gene_type:complete